MSVEKTLPDGQQVSESAPKDIKTTMSSVKTETRDEEVPAQGSITAVEADGNVVPDRLTGMKLRGTTFA